MYTDTLTELTGHEGFIQFISVHPESNLVFSTSRDETIRVWDIEELNVVSEYDKFHVEWDSKIVVIPKYNLIALSRKETFDIYRLEKPQSMLFTSPFRMSDISTIALSNDGIDLYIGYYDGRILGWDLSKLNLSSTEWYTIKENPGYCKAYILQNTQRFLLDCIQAMCPW